jgi:hypothetical protein
MVVVDQKVRFDAFQYDKNDETLEVTGTVYAVNYEHKVFHVVYCIDGRELRTSFKFCDIGTKVKVVTANGCI